jgi:hypothetical protein
VCERLLVRGVWLLDAGDVRSSLRRLYIAGEQVGRAARGWRVCDDADATHASRCPRCVDCLTRVRETLDGRHVREYVGVGTGMVIRGSYWMSFVQRYTRAPALSGTVVLSAYVGSWYYSTLHFQVRVCSSAAGRRPGVGWAS